MKLSASWGGLVSIEEQITAALDSRAVQRSFVEDLASNWDVLANSFKDLTSAAEDLAHAAGSAHVADTDHTAVFNELDRFLNGRAEWQQRAAKLSVRLSECTERVSVLQARVTRQTVNIGVIGVTGAGKSTLLRKLSGLGLEHIPSNKTSSSTATPSRIFHESGTGTGRAVLHPHTWDSFRAEVLVPLHREAKLPQPAPTSIGEFRRFDYDQAVVPVGQAGAERYLIRLRKAHDSLDSYQDLLRGGAEEISLDRLRAFVAYPPDEASRNRPYHAVRSVDIFCQFPEVGTVRLGLVDLPGSGEAGLDVHGRFLASLRNQTDLLFIVKRPSKSPGTEQDWIAKQLADDAGAGVRLQDFAYQVINRDVSLPGEFYQAGLDRAMREGGGLAGEILECDIEGTSSAGVIQAVLMPVLKHLAVRLADMDHAAVMFVLSGLTDVAADVQSLAAELTGAIDGWQRRLPDEVVRHRDRVWSLRNAIGARLRDVVRSYDELYVSGAPIAELSEEITRAGAAVRSWVAAGMGEKSTEDWLATYDRARGPHEGHERDRQYNNARMEIVDQFSKIDASLHLAIQRLWGEVAGALRAELKETIVPDNADNEAALHEFARIAGEAEARTLREATERLLTLQQDYGNIFLRVGRPIVRKVSLQEEENALAAMAEAVAKGVATGVAKGVASGVAEGVASAVLGSHGGGGQSAQTPWWQGGAGRGTAGLAEPVKQAVSGLIGAMTTLADDDPAAKRYPEAAKRYRRLTATIDRVTGELEQEFEKEAKRTLTILAAAADYYRDTTTSTKGTEVDYERVSGIALREIWPEAYDEDSANVTADMAAIRQQATSAEAAARHVTELIGRVRRLSTGHA